MKEHGTERLTGAEHRQHTRCYRGQQLGHLARECQHPVPKDNPQAPAKSFFMPGDAFAQLHNLVCYMAFTGVSEALDGSPDGFKNEADWAASNDESEPQDDTSEPKHRDFVCLILAPARGLTDAVAQQPVCLSCSMVVRTTSQATRSGVRGCDTGQHDSHLWRNRASQCGTSSGFPCWTCGCEQSDALSGA